MNHGRVNPTQTLEKQGIGELGTVYYNQIEPALIESAVMRGEGSLGIGGAFLVTTGKFTGRSPKDKFVVRTPSVEDTIWWENNAPMAPEAFATLREDMLAHMKGRDYFVQDLYAGAEPTHRLDVRIVAEMAWHGLFVRHLLRRPERAELDSFVPDWTIINCPGFKADPARHGCRTETVIALNFDAKEILIANTAYAGENKKAVFTLLNYLLPGKGVMAMHCSANHAVGDPDDAAVFFGLSGTGKTTLSADPSRTLIGDDEHGWSDKGSFNFEGGCYAKTINLRAEAEPEIHATTHRFGTVVENMVYDPGTGNVSLPLRLHLQGRRNRARRDRAPADIFNLLWRAFHATSSRSLWQAAPGKDCPPRRDLLAGQHRLDRRCLWHRQPHADPCHTGFADRRPEWLARAGRIPPRCEFRL